MIMRKKVFVIGMFRTGTTSVAHALGVLGYNVTSRPWFVLRKANGQDDNK